MARTQGGTAQRPPGGPGRTEAGPDDRTRWDARYRSAGDGLLFGARPAPLLRRVAHLLPRRGRALDLACGEGQNALFLAARGLTVTGIDVSPVAVARAREQARRRGLPLRVVVGDLGRRGLRRGWYDLVTCFHFLDRRLVPAMAAALRPGGVVVVEIATAANLRLHRRPGRRFVLRAGELRRWFPGLDLLYYREGRIGAHEQAQVVARRPAGPSPR